VWERSGGNAAHDADWESGGVEAVELRAATSDIAARRSFQTFRAYVEIPITADPTGSRRRHCSAFAKVGPAVTADAFPASTGLAVSRVVRRGVSLATWLHHPLRWNYPLTYEPGSSTEEECTDSTCPRDGVLRAGLGETVAREILEEHDASSLTFDEAGVAWRGHRLSASQLADARALAIRSFGSCSFREPFDDLTALGML
jgi:hypothetical protein